MSNKPIKPQLPKPFFKVCDNVIYKENNHYIVGVIRATQQNPKVRYLLNGIGPAVLGKEIYTKAFEREEE